MDQTLRTPNFETEGDEANWWFQNQNQLAQNFERAAVAGKLGRGTVARRGNTPTTTIRLNPEDIEKARYCAAQKGLKYQTYLKMLIHQALQQETVPKMPFHYKENVMSNTPKRIGLDGRSRDANGEIRKKRSDTLVGTLREQYGDSIAKGYRSDAKLGTVLKREGLEDLSQLLKKKG